MSARRQPARDVAARRRLRRAALSSATLAAALALTGASAPPAAHAGDGEAIVAATVETPRVRATLAPEVTVARPGDGVEVMLHQRLADGWHTYWENPGDSGQRIRMHWTLPDGVSAGELRYPVPEAIRVGPLVNHGYSHEVTLLARIAVPADWPSGEPLAVRARASWLVCEEVCIPEEASFEFSLPTGDRAVPQAALTARFERARASLPRAAPGPVSVRAGGDRMLLQVGLPRDAATSGAASGAHFFAREWGRIAHAAPQPARIEDGVLEIALAAGELGAGEHLDGVLALGRGESRRGFDVSAPVQAVPVAALAGATAAAGLTGSAVPAPTLPVLLAFAVLGGLLLNLMPCVFPVIAVKAMSLVHHAGEPARTRVAGGLAYGAGVLSAFLALAAALLALKAGGEAVGWGFHLQVPGVVATLALVLFAVGLSLSGVLEVGGAWAGAGSSLAARGGLAGSFFTGVLATVVAAPCTAPFMATAIGVALLQSAPAAIAVFLALGAGLAAPFVALAAWPALAARLPRPGIWMERLKQVLAFPMYASAAWLAWVLAQLSGADAVGLLLLAMVALGLAAWCWRAARDAGVRLARVARGCSGAAAAAALAALAAAAVLPPGDVDAARAGDATAVRYEPARLEQVLADGGAVLLNVTAAWCVTCKVNEGVALSGATFRRDLQAAGVTYMKGDWTRRDPQLTSLLERFGRAGVPLYVLFPRGGGPPQVLPQVLTRGIVRDALEAA